MPAVASPTISRHTVLAVNALLQELSLVPDHTASPWSQLRLATSRAAAAARAEAIGRLSDARRMAILDSATEALASACARRQLSRPARAAAYSALLALIAADLVAPATFRTLSEAWEVTIGHLSGSSAVLDGEEVLLHLDGDPAQRVR